MKTRNNVTLGEWLKIKEMTDGGDFTARQIAMKTGRAVDTVYKIAASESFEGFKKRGELYRWREPKSPALVNRRYIFDYETGELLGDYATEAENREAWERFESVERAISRRTERANSNAPERLAWVDQNRAIMIIDSPTEAWAERSGASARSWRF